MASAQVKSAILLAGLFAEGETEVVEKLPTRDHTEIALELMGADIGRHQRTIAVRGRARLEGKKLYVPGDISSAAFFIVAGLMVPNSNLMLHNVGLNPTRTALLDLLVPMGGRVKVVNLEMLNGELLGDLHVDSSQLAGGEIPEELVPGLIDELPVLAVLGTQTEKGLTFRGRRGTAREGERPPGGRGGKPAPHGGRSGGISRRAARGRPAETARRGNRSARRPPHCHGLRRRRPGGGRHHRHQRQFLRGYFLSGFLRDASARGGVKLMQGMERSASRK